MQAIHFVFLVGVIALSESQRVTHKTPLNETVPHADVADDSGRYQTAANHDDIIEQAVRKAANYILNERLSDYNWEASTTRAVIALIFAKTIRPLDENEMNLMKKQLTIQLYLDLMQKQKMSLSRLARSINALFAMCEDPRNFHGIDLVNLLRTEADSGLESNESSPLVLLTLCIAGESQYDDLVKLTNMYTSHGNDRIGYKALALMALICIRKESKSFAITSYKLFEDYERTFFSEYRNLEDGHFDIYTKALFIQAANSAGWRTRVTRLLRGQLENGSFGDLLATYYAIPALLGTSLLDLKCKLSDTHRGDNLENELSTSGSNGKNVSISIWITSDGVSNSHSMVLNFGDDETLYDIMKKAEARDPTFRFMWEKTAKEMEFYGLAGIPNDAEAGKSWSLYSGKADKVKVNSKHNLREETYGIKVKPKEDNNYIFWWES